MRSRYILALAAIFPLAIGTACAADLGKRDQDYLRERAVSIMVDVQAGQMASQRATTDLVRAFAYRLVNDHQRMLDDLRKLAAARKVELPAAPGESELKSVTRLEGLAGRDFDEQYIRRAINEHKDHLRTDRKIRYGSKDPEMRALAGASHDLEDAHLALANRALSNVPAK